MGFIKSMASKLSRRRRLYIALVFLAIYGGGLIGAKFISATNVGEVFISLLLQSNLEVNDLDRSQSASKLGIDSAVIGFKNVSGLEGNRTSGKKVFDDKANLKRQKGEEMVRKFERLPFVKDPAYKQSVCPKTVSSVTKYSKWFRERFVPGIKVFIDKEDIHGLNDLNAYGLPFGIDRVNQTFAEILNNPSFRNPELPLHGSSQQCIKCAVVGCGGILNGSEAGREIDGHDYVFRLNRAISGERHVKDVGEKTTFYTFFPESEHISDVKSKNVTSLYAMFKPYDVTYALHMIKDIKPPNASGVNGLYTLRKPKVNPSKIKIIHPSFFRYVFTKYMDGVSYRPTTGAVAVVMALHLCDEVNIYGFGYDHRFTLHYYDKQFIKHPDNFTSLHDVDNERILWKKLHDEGILRLFKREE